MKWKVGLSSEGREVIRVMVKAGLMAAASVLLHALVRTISRGEPLEQCGSDYGCDHPDIFDR
jgi:hypothetical protein